MVVFFSLLAFRSLDFTFTGNMSSSKGRAKRSLSTFFATFIVFIRRIAT